MKKAEEPERAVGSQQITRCYAPEDINLHNYSSEDLKEYNNSGAHLQITSGEYRISHEVATSQECTVEFQH